MSIDRAEVKRIAALAQLSFSDEQLSKLQSELSKILEYIDQLKSVDTSGIDVHLSTSPTPLREDLVHASLSTEEVAANAPAFVHGHFVVPRVIGGE